MVTIPDFSITPEVAFGVAEQTILDEIRMLGGFTSDQEMGEEAYSLLHEALLKKRKGHTVGTFDEKTWTFSPLTSIGLDFAHAQYLASVKKHPHLTLVSSGGQDQDDPDS